MRPNILFLSLAVPLVSSQCLIDDPEYVSFIELGKECTYDKFQSRVRQARNLLKDENEDNNCLSSEEELAALLGLSPDNLDAIKAKIESICDQAISHSRNDEEFIVHFEDIPLFTDESVDRETIQRFLKEFYDGGTFFNEEIQQTGTDDKKKLNHATEGIKEFYRGSARNNLVKWPSSSVNNFEQCEFNTVMCCWVQDRFDDGNGDGDCYEPYPSGKLGRSELWTPDDCIDKDPADNTDICYVDMARSPRSNHVVEGAVIFDDIRGVREGDAHCHGLAWADDDLSMSHRYRANNLFYVSMYDHLRERGYVRNVPGAPMCGCVEQMPTVSRSDCTEMDVQETFVIEYQVGLETFHATITEARIEFNACQGANNNNNDLKAYYKRLVNEGAVTNKLEAFGDYLVGENNCGPAVKEFLKGYGIVRK